MRGSRWCAVALVAAASCSSGNGDEEGASPSTSSTSPTSITDVPAPALTASDLQAILIPLEVLPAGWSEDPREPEDVEVCGHRSLKEELPTTAIAEAMFRSGDGSEILAEGLRYARRTPSVLWPLVLLGGTAALAMNFQTLLPLFARTLGTDAGGYGALFAAIGVGALIGSLGLAFMASQRPMKGLILGGAAAFLALTFALGFARSPMVAFPLVIGIGLASMLMINTINVTIQNAVPDALRGRVMALYVTVFAGTAPIGGLLAGALAQAFGAPVAFSVGAALGAGVLVLVAWNMRAVLPEARSVAVSAPVRLEVDRRAA